MAPQLYYLASPYSHPDADVRELRFQQVCEAAAWLLRAGVYVFSPIAHSHPIARFGLPKGWDWWREYDFRYLSICAGTIVLMMPGWRESVGVTDEIAETRAQGKPLVHLDYPLDPDDVRMAKAVLGLPVSAFTVGRGP